MTFTADELRAAVGFLVEELTDRGTAARITILGGAAMALVHDADRRSTRDIGALYHPEREVEEAAAAVAARHGYPDDWLNNNVRIFLPHHGEHEDQALVATKTVRVTVGDPRLLLAMKMKASRGRRDLDDIRVLVRHCGIASIAEADELFEHFYRDDELTPRAKALLEVVFSELSA